VILVRLVLTALRVRGLATEVAIPYDPVTLKQLRKVEAVAFCTEGVFLTNFANDGRDQCTSLVAAHRQFFLWTAHHLLSRLHVRNPEMFGQVPRQHACVFLVLKEFF